MTYIVTNTLKDNIGNIIANETDITACVYNSVDGTLIVRKTGLSTNSAGIMIIFDPSFSRSISYRIIIKLQSGAIGLTNNGVPLGPLHTVSGDIFGSTSAVVVSTASHSGLLPSWLPGIGEIASVSTNAIVDVRAGDNEAATLGITEAWSGMGYVPTYGAYGSFILTGGGHNDGSLNAIYRYDITTRAFTKIKNSAAVFAAGGYIGDTVTGWMWDSSAGTTTQVGEPWTAHYYGGLVGVPATAKAGVTNGLLITLGRCTMPNNAGNPPTGATSQSHQIRLGQDTTWTLLGADLDTGTGFGGSCYDATRNRVVSKYGDISSKLEWVDLDDDSVGSLTLLSSYNGFYHTLFHDAASDLYISADAGTPTDIKLVNPTTGAVTTPTLSGTAPTGPGGFEWVEAYGCLVFFRTAGGGSVYTLKRPADPIAGTWVWASHAVTGETMLAPANTNPHHTRCKYIAALDTFFWIARANAAVQAFRITAP